MADRASRWPHAVTLLTEDLRREALTGLLDQQAAKQRRSYLPDAVEERPPRGLTSVHRAVRKKPAENRQRRCQC
jgi:hypothetical protein